MVLSMNFFEDGLHPDPPITSVVVPRLQVQIFAFCKDLLTEADGTITPIRLFTDLTETPREDGYIDLDGRLLISLNKTDGTDIGDLSIYITPVIEDEVFFEETAVLKPTPFHGPAKHMASVFPISMLRVFWNASYLYTLYEDMQPVTGTILRIKLDDDAGPRLTKRLPTTPESHYIRLTNAVEKILLAE